MPTGTVRGQAKRRTSTYIVHEKNADDRQAKDFRSHDGSSTAAADSTVISGGGCSVATALCWAAGVYGREWFPYGTTESDRD